MGTKFTEKEINRRIAEGYGQGELENYKPWLTVNDVTSSNSRAHKVYSWKINRIHHLLSDNEFNYFVCLEWSDEVKDIREQYPLDRAMTVPISKRIGISHPFQNETYYVMSTDFLITLSDGRTLARTFKQASDLEKESVINKFQIEQLYWHEQGIDWGIVTEKELDMTLVRNLTDLRQYIDYIEAQKITSDFVKYILREVSNSKCSLLEVFEKSDLNFASPTGTSLSTFKCLIANKQLSIDIFKPFSVQDSCECVLIEADIQERLA